MEMMTNVCRPSPRGLGPLLIGHVITFWILNHAQTKGDWSVTSLPGNCLVEAPGMQLRRGGWEGTETARTTTHNPSSL